MYPGWAVAERGLSRLASRVSRLVSHPLSVCPSPSARPGEDELTQEQMNHQGGRAAVITATAGGAGGTVRAHESYVFVGEGTEDCFAPREPRNSTPRPTPLG